MIVGQINRTVALVVELLHFSQNMLRRTEAPFAVGQRGNVAINAGVRTAARRLHRAEFFQRQHRRHVERQRFDVINRQRHPVGIWKLVQILDDRAGDVLDDFFTVAPDQPGDAGRRGEVVQIIRQQFFALAHAHGVNVWTILQNPLLVHRGKNAAADDRNIRQLVLDHLRHAFHAGISRRGQKRERHHIRRVIPQRLRDVRLLHFRVAGVEHPDLMPVLAQNGRERLDAQRREAHHLHARIARLGAAQIFRQQPVEILVVHPDEEYFHKQRPFLVRRIGGSGIGDGDTKTRGMGLPKNLSRADQLVIAIGFNDVCCVFRNQNRPNPVSNLLPPVLDGSKCEMKSLPIIPFLAGNAIYFVQRLPAIFSSRQEQSPQKTMSFFGLSLSLRRHGNILGQPIRPGL